MFFSSCWESALSKDVSTSPDIMFRLCILVISCTSFIKLNINLIFDFFPPKGGFLFLFSLRITLIKQSKTSFVLKSNKQLYSCMYMDLLKFQTQKAVEISNLELL